MFQPSFWWCRISQPSTVPPLISRFWTNQPGHFICRCSAGRDPRGEEPRVTKAILIKLRKSHPQLTKNLPTGVKCVSTKTWWCSGCRLIWGRVYKSLAGWWFQSVFIFHNIWDNPSHWLIFFQRGWNYQPGIFSIIYQWIETTDFNLSFRLENGPIVRPSWLRFYGQPQSLGFTPHQWVQCLAPVDDWYHFNGYMFGIFHWISLGYMHIYT